MAEAIFRRIVAEQGLSPSFDIQSYATSGWEEGNPVYPPARRALESHGIVGFTHRSQVLSLQAVKNSDYILVMDNMNMLDVVRMTAGRYGDKIFKLGHFLDEQIDIADPYYTGDFERSYREIDGACRAFLQYVMREHAQAIDYDRRHSP